MQKGPSTSTLLRYGRIRTNPKQTVEMQKGGEYATLTLDENMIWALHDVFDEMLERDYRTRDQRNALTPVTPPIDVNPPNQHENKSAFLLEKRAVDSALENAEELFRTFIPEGGKSDDVEAMLRSLGLFIDGHAKKNADISDNPGAHEIVRGSARMAGLKTSFLWLLIDMTYALQTRSNELKDQEKEFWTGPPNYHARTIALRTARVYAREKGERPKFGTQRDGGAPSTSFARALEKIFEIVGINAGVRGPAEWAIAELTDDDLKSPQNALMGGLLGLASTPTTIDSGSRSLNALAELPSVLLSRAALRSHT